MSSFSIGQLENKKRFHSLIHSVCGVKSNLSVLKITETQRNYASPISCCCDCPSSGSLIFGGQIVHINEGKGKLALFSTIDNVLLTQHPPTPLQLIYFPFLILLFIFSFPPQFSSLLHNFIIFPPHSSIPSFSTILSFSLLLLHISIVFPHNHSSRKQDWLA